MSRNEAGMAVTGIYSCPAEPFHCFSKMSQLQTWRSKGWAHHLALSVRRWQASVVARSRLEH